MDIDGKEIQPENYDIILSNVTFSYDKRKIIDDVSLSIPQKTTTTVEENQQLLDHLVEENHAEFFTLQSDRQVLGCGFQGWK